MRLPVLAAAAVLTACVTIEEAQLVLPPSFAEEDRLAISGLSPGRRSTYRAGPYQGVLEWGASRSELGERFVGKRSEVFTTVEAPGLAVLTADCRSDERSIRLGLGNFAIEVPVNEVALFCELRSAGNAQPGAIMLRRARPNDLISLDMPEEGLVRFGAETYVIGSLHRVRGAPRAPGALGYAVSRGIEIMMVADQTTRPPVVRFAEGLSETEKQRLFLTAMVLEGYVDPGEL